MIRNEDLWAIFVTIKFYFQHGKTMQLRMRGQSVRVSSRIYYKNIKYAVKIFVEKFKHVNNPVSCDTYWVTRNKQLKSSATCNLFQCLTTHYIKSTLSSNVICNKHKALNYSNIMHCTFISI